MERLHRSKTNKVIFGVCGGFAEYFRIDPTIIRIICIIIAFSGAGIPAYIIAALVIPDEGSVSSGRRSSWGNPSNNAESSWKKEWEGTSSNRTDSFANDMKDESDKWDESNKWDEPVKYNSERNRFVLGAILVGLGVLFLGRQMIPALFKLDYMVPLLLVAIGGFIIYRGRH